MAFDKAGLPFIQEDTEAGMPMSDAFLYLREIALSCG